MAQIYFCANKLLLTKKEMQIEPLDERLAIGTLQPRTRG